MPFQKASQLVSTPTGSRRAWTPPVPATSRMWSLWVDGEYAHLPCPPFLLSSQPCSPLRKMEELICATPRTYRHRFMNKNLPIFYGPAYQHVRNATSLPSSLQPRLTSLLSVPLFSSTVPMQPHPTAHVLAINRPSTSSLVPDPLPPLHPNLPLNPPSTNQTQPDRNRRQI